MGAEAKMVWLALKIWTRNDKRRQGSEFMRLRPGFSQPPKILFLRLWEWVGSTRVVKRPLETP